VPRPLISLLTDFGARDPSAAIMRGTILGIAPDVEILDISHEVRKFAIRDGALLLWCALPYLPVGSHVAVVDPGVGTARRPIALRTGRGDVLIGPDNGLLLGPVEPLGGVRSVVELRETRYRLPAVSTSFHGRDIFAPAAAHLALGVPLEAFGPAVDPATLVPSPLPPPLVQDGLLATSVIYVDTFGNVKLSALADDLQRALGELPPGGTLTVSGGGRTMRIPWLATFGDADRGAPLLYADSYGRLCLAVNQGHAANALGLMDDMELEIRRHSGLSGL
jgi:S-adenosylmethionine hydrolase